MDWVHTYALKKVNVHILRNHCITSNLISENSLSYMISKGPFVYIFSLPFDFPCTITLVQRHKATIPNRDGDVTYFILEWNVT